MATPGERLKRHREKLELSQAEFGAKIGASQAQVSRIEGGGCPTLEQAVAIQRLDVGLDVECWPWIGAMATYLSERRRRAS